MAQAFFGGVHPNDMKAATNEKAIEQLEAPAEVVIPMSMHIGAPCKPIVAVGDKVTIGQKIGEPGGFVSAPIHASVSGTVKAVEPRPFSMGGTMMSVVIENDFQNTVCPDIHPVEDPDSLTPEQLVEIVKNAGIVGQGGATFPTHVKISSGLGKVDYVIINAAECEPYITADDRFIGLAYEWEFEPVCWVISHLETVTAQYRAEFIAVYDDLFERWPDEYESYVASSEDMRAAFTARRRRIPILHRNGGFYLLSPGSERLARSDPRQWRKFGPYRNEAHA